MPDVAISNKNIPDFRPGYFYFIRFSNVAADRVDS